MPPLINTLSLDKRKLLLISKKGWVLGIIVLISISYGIWAFYFSEEHSVNPVLAASLAGLGLAALYSSIDSAKGTAYYSPMVFALLFLIGYPIKLLHMLVSRDSYQSIGFDSIGQFGFSALEYSNVMAIACFGMAGVVIGQMAVKALIYLFTENIAYLNLKNRAIYSLMLWIRRSIGFLHAPPKEKVFSLLVLFFIFGMVLNSVMWILGIGQVGLMGGQKALPFHLLGIMYYARLFLIPVINFALLGWCLELGNRRMVLWALSLILIEAIFCGIVSISRSTLVYRVAPVVLFLALSKPFHQRQARLAIKLFAAVVVAFLLLYPAIQSLRNIGYSKGSINMADMDVGAFVSEQSDESIGSRTNTISSFALRRVMGIGELMAVASYPMKDMDIFWAMVENSGEAGSIQPEIFGLSLSDEGGLSFGVSLGFFGSLFLSGSLWVVLIGATIVSGTIMFVEDILMRLGLPLLGCGIGTIFTLLVWDGRDTRTIMYGIVMILIGYALLKTIFSSLPPLNRINVENP